MSRLYPTHYITSWDIQVRGFSQCIPSFKTVSGYLFVWGAIHVVSKRLKTPFTKTCPEKIRTFFGENSTIITMGGEEVELLRLQFQRKKHGMKTSIRETYKVGPGKPVISRGLTKHGDILGKKGEISRIFIEYLIPKNPIPHQLWDWFHVEPTRWASTS